MGVARERIKSVLFLCSSLQIDLEALLRLEALQHQGRSE
jgi:hypothetical protein